MVRKRHEKKRRKAVMIETELRLTGKAAAEFQKKMLKGDEESQKLRDAF